MTRQISISDEVFDEAETLRIGLGMTSEGFYDEAVLLMKAKYRGNITEQLNQLCKEVDTSVDPVLSALQEQVLARSNDHTDDQSYD